ncbi:MAG TPA: MFS transporter [Opitutaceae bacterium]|nr:MFS transporter [Opitutaceae bacterium]
MAPPSPAAGKTAHVFSGYEKFVIAILAFLQFTIVLDFMILSPLGAILLPALRITTSQFGAVVSAYAVAAAISGLLAAGFADRFDRKRMLLFFYVGFILGTALCGFAPNYHVLFIARTITGLFGGVIGAVSFAIVADLFPLQVRGRVMGFVTSAFAASQVLGLPLGIYFAAKLGWHSPFIMIASIAGLVGIIILFRLKPIDAHLTSPTKRNPLQHLLKTATSRRYITGFSATMLLATGGFMLMPFGAAFSVNNLGIPLDELPMIYAVTGCTSLILGPLIGRISDRVGKYRTFCVATLVGTVVVIGYTRLGVTPIWAVILISIVLFASISGRMVAAGALASAVPAPEDRGAYMSISASLQQFAGALSSMVAGWIVVQNPATGRLNHYPLLGVVVGSIMLLTILLMYNVHQLVSEQLPTSFAPTPAAEV